MMKKLLIIFMLLLFAAGCQQQEDPVVEEPVEQTVWVDVDLSTLDTSLMQIRHEDVTMQVVKEKDFYGVMLNSNTCFLIYTIEDGTIYYSLYDAKSGNTTLEMALIDSSKAQDYYLSDLTELYRKTFNSIWFPQEEIEIGTDYNGAVLYLTVPEDFEAELELGEFTADGISRQVILINQENKGWSSTLLTDDQKLKDIDYSIDFDAKSITVADQSQILNITDNAVIKYGQNLAAVFSLDDEDLYYLSYGDPLHGQTQILMTDTVVEEIRNTMSQKAAFEETFNGSNVGAEKLKQKAMNKFEEQVNK